MEQTGGGTAWRQLSHLQWRFSPTLLKLAEVFINVSDLKWESTSICVQVTLGMPAPCTFINSVWTQTHKKKKSNIHIIFVYYYYYLKGFLFFF